MQRAAEPTFWDLLRVVFTVAKNQATSDVSLIATMMLMYSRDCSAVLPARVLSSLDQNLCAAMPSAKTFPCEWEKTLVFLGQYGWSKFALDQLRMIANGVSDEILCEGAHRLRSGE